MKETYINCASIKTPEDLHRIFREALCFPVCYGNNLDALYDCLTEISGKLRLADWEIAEENLGAYGRKAKKVIATAALQNTALDLYL